MENNFQIAADNKKEDKKHFLPFLLLLLLSGLFGGVLGYISISILKKADLTNLYQMLGNWQLQIVPCFRIILPAFLVAFIVVLFWLNASIRKLFRKWDGEDEEIYKKLEKRITVGLGVTGVGYQCTLLFFGIATYCLDKTTQDKDMWMIMVSLVSLVVSIAATLIFQGKFVNMTKELYPEKKGSIYDMKFQKKWMDSCDEAEKFMIYHACYKVFFAMSKVYMVLSMVFLILGMFFEIGLMPLVIVMILWLISQIIYYVESTKEANQYMQ